MLSTDLKRLYETFKAWRTGEPLTMVAWLQFERDLKDAWVRSAMLELGVNVRVLDLQNEIADSDGKIVVLDRRRPVVVPIGDGGAK
jgi:hypothetical protein